MQIISSQEAYRRLTTPDNLLNKIGQGIPSEAPVGVTVETEIAESFDQPNETGDSSIPVEGTILSGPIPDCPSQFKFIEPSPLEYVEKSPEVDKLLEGVLEMVDEDGKLPPKYRGQRGKAMPAILRQMVGIEAHFDRNQNVAQEYAISPAQVSEYKRGHVGGKKDESLQEAIESELGKVRKRAQRKLMQALKLIDNDSLAGLDAVQLSNVAAKMSTVVQQSIPAHLKEAAKDENDNRPQFVVMVPQVHTESKYKQIEVGG